MLGLKYLNFTGEVLEILRTCFFSNNSVPSTEWPFEAMLAVLLTCFSTVLVHLWTYWHSIIRWRYLTTLRAGLARRQSLRALMQTTGFAG